MNIKLKEVVGLINDYDILSIYILEEKREYWENGQINELDDNGHFIRASKEKADINQIILSHFEWNVCGLCSGIDGGISISIEQNVENEIDYEEKYKRLIKSINRISQDFGFNQSLCLVVDHIDKDIVDDIAKIREEETKKHLKNFIEKCQEIKLIHLPSFESEEK